MPRRPPRTRRSTVEIVGEREARHERPGSRASTRRAERRLRQLLRDEVPGAGAEAGAGVGARADVPEALDGRPVARRRRANGRQSRFWSSAQRAGVDVAADEVAVQRLDVGGGEDDAAQAWRSRGSSIDSPSRAHDPVRVRLAELLRPGAVADVELARGIALDPAGRELLQLDPDDPLARRARATGRLRTAGRRRSSPPPAAARARPR